MRSRLILATAYLAGFVTGAGAASPSTPVIDDFQLIHAQPFAKGADLKFVQYITYATGRTNHNNLCGLYRNSSMSDYQVFLFYKDTGRVILPETEGDITMNRFLREDMHCGDEKWLAARLSG